MLICVSPSVWLFLQLVDILEKKKKRGFPTATIAPTF